VYAAEPGCLLALVKSHPRENDEEYLDFQQFVLAVRGVDGGESEVPARHAWPSVKRKIERRKEGFQR
jgi:hypothetical protein